MLSERSNDYIVFGTLLYDHVRDIVLYFLLCYGEEWEKIQENVEEKREFHLELGNRDEEKDEEDEDTFVHSPWSQPTN